MRNFLTVDVEEWFHICGVGGALGATHWNELPSRVERTTEILLDLLDRCQTRATFFVLGWIAERHPALVARIAACGHPIGSHGWSHTRVYDLDAQSFQDEVRCANRALEAAGAPRPSAFRAPEWSINARSLWALEVLARNGFSVDSSMTPLRILGDPSYPQVPHVLETPAGRLAEVPPMVRRRFGQNLPLGGGWGLRMCRPATVLRAIAERNQRDEPVTLFVHPWELDPEPPRVKLPAALAFSHFFRLEGFGARLNDIVRGADFGPIPSNVAGRGA